MATAFGVIGAPGNGVMEFICGMAGRDGRISVVEFRPWLATAFDISAPDTLLMEFMERLVGRDGRIVMLEFIANLATAFGVIGVLPQSAQACARWR
jgi:hypothetical protein